MPNNILSSDIIALTGHRDYPDRAAMFRGLDRLRAKEYILGGARGFDSDALEYLGKTQPGSKRTVMVPNRLSNQPVSTRAITRKWSTNLVELRNSGYNRYRVRNEAMVNKSTHVRAFYDFRGSGGTYNTIKYAQKSGKSMDVWSMKNFNQDEIMKKSPSQFKSWLGNMKGMKVNLSALKRLIIQFILEVLHQTVQDFLNTLGYIGLKSLEALWAL